MAEWDRAFCGTSEQCDRCMMGQIPDDDPNKAVVAMTIAAMASNAVKEFPETHNKSVGLRILHHFGGTISPIEPLHEQAVLQAGTQMAYGHCFNKELGEI